MAAGFTAIGVIGKGVSGIISGFTFLTSPVGIVTAAIVGLIVAGYALYKNWDTIKLKASELKNKIVEMVMAGVENFNEFKDKAKEILGIPFDYLATKIENLKNLGKDLKDYFLELFEEIKNFSLTDAISDGASYLVGKAKQHIMDLQQVG